MKAGKFVAFKPFSWLPDGTQTPATEFCEAAYDIARGIALAIDIANVSHIQRDNGHGPGQGDPPVLGINETETMLMFAKASARLLVNYAEEQMEVQKRVKGRPE